MTAQPELVSSTPTEARFAYAVPAVIHQGTHTLLQSIHPPSGA
jgi:hypothetical protein